jgi:cytochrome P450
MSTAQIDPTLQSEASLRDELIAKAATMPLEEMDVSYFRLFQEDAVLPYFERLRKEDPIHYHANGFDGPYWSITRFDDIKFVDSNHKLFSSEPTISIVDEDANFKVPMFIAMDQPKHDVQRKSVSPVVAPRNLAEMEGLIRERTCRVLDSLPIDQEFDWVEEVSIELTTMMLATLFNFPFEDRRKLTFWSDAATSTEMTREERTQALMDCLTTFTQLWQERKGEEPAMDLISMLAHGDATQNMIQNPMEYLGNLILLIVGGNDTTRNSMTASVLGLNQFPTEFDKLRANPELIPNMVAEVIRWQTPLAHMRRTALEDVEIGGKTIKKGDKVVMWYLSGNYDESHFEDPNRLIIDRKNARQHISFGFGIHRCMGNRLAELQLRILWEEILKRFDDIEVLGEPERVRSNMVRGYVSLPVKVRKKQ